MTAKLSLTKQRAFSVSVGTAQDITDHVLNPGGLAEQFWHESEFKNFMTPDRDLPLQTWPRLIETGRLHLVMGWFRSEPRGFLLFSVDRYYTVESMANLFLFYVSKGRRFGPLGRMMTMLAELLAAEWGAVVMYMGATANIGGGTDERMMNMLDRMGYMRLGGVSRKILSGDAGQTGPDNGG